MILSGNSESDFFYINKAIELALDNIKIGGGPFGAVIVEDNKIIAESGNNVRSKNDPTAHAEVEAIRLACTIKNSYSLENCIIYSSCEPCPMCLGAIYWSGIKQIVFGASRKDAEYGGFNDNLIYNEIALPFNKRAIKTFQIHTEKSIEVFKLWNSLENKLSY